MDLAKFAAMPQESTGAFLKFTPSENVKIVRFCYNTPEDIQARQKLYDPTTRKVIWDTPEGKWTLQLKVAVYSSKEKYDMMTWERSARFGADVLLPVFESAGGNIIDTVYKVTCTKAGTLDATYSLFPLKDSSTFAFPQVVTAGESKEADDEDVFASQPAPAPQKNVAPAPTTHAAPQRTTTPNKQKNFWEV